MFFRNTEPSPVFSRGGGGHRRASVSSTNMSANATAKPVVTSKKARVLYDYDAADTTELSLLADEVSASD